MDNGLEKLLVQLNNIVEIKRRQLEVLLREYGLLLKPWPKHDKNVKHKSAEEDSEYQTNDKAKGQHPVINAEEQKEVDLVENLLARAQKARDLKKKLHTKDTSSDNHHLLKDLQLDLKPGNQSENSSIPETTIRSEIRNLILQAKVKSSENSSSDSVKNKKNRATLQSKDVKDDKKSDSSSNHCVKTSHVHDSHTRRASHGRTASHTRVTSHAGNVPAPRSASHGRSVSYSDKAPPKSNSAKSSSHSRTDVPAPNTNYNSSASNVKDATAPFKAARVPRPNSSRGRAYSAHVTAPFKTDPTLRVPRMSTNKVAMVTKRGSHTGRPSSREKLKSKPVHNESDVKTDPTTDNLSGRNNPGDEKQLELQDEKSIVDNIPDLIKHTTVNHIATSKNDIEDCSKDVGQRLVSGMSDLKIAETDADGQPIPSSQDENFFTLQEDGAKILIPGKLRRQIAANQKLREKLTAQRVTKKVESTDARRDFLQRLEDQFDPDEDLVTQSRVLSCHYAHTHLLQLLEELHIDNITELSPVSEVLTAKMKMEYILACCNSLQEEMDLLHRADFSVDLNKASPLLSQHKEASVSQWLPDALMGDLVICPDAVLSYGKRSDLQAYKHNIFELQYQRLQFVVMETVKKELLPLLQDTERNSRSYVNVYRAVFAFLTSNDGHHLPGIVRDS